MRIRIAESDDVDVLATMRNDLWPDTLKTHKSTLADFFNNRPSHIDQIVVCSDSIAGLVGFAELRVRNYAEGSSSLQVPFLEGWFVRQDYRGRGIGEKLIEEAGVWAKSLGFSELASNTLLDNPEAIQAHVAVGFQEMERTVCFLKVL